MTRQLSAEPVVTTDRGTRVALVYALVAERLSLFYEHGCWLTEAQGASLAAEWLARRRSELSIKARKHLSDLSDRMAREIESALSREAGLYTAHEMMESLDPNYYASSAMGQALMRECERLLATNDAENADG